MSSAISTDPGLRPWQLFLLAGMLAATGVVLVSSGKATSGVIVLSLTVVTASLVAVAAFRVLSPLVSGEVEAAPDAAPPEGRTRAALEREKALVLRSIKELEFDHAMRKIDTAEFEEMRDRLRVRALGLMRQLEASGYREAVERDLQARHPGEPPVVVAMAPPPSTCETCQTVNDPDARFCKQCGSALGVRP